AGVAADFHPGIISVRSILSLPREAVLLIERPVNICRSIRLRFEMAGLAGSKISTAIARPLTGLPRCELLLASIFGHRLLIGDLSSFASESPKISICAMVMIVG